MRIDDPKLPIDVRVGPVLFRKGTSLSTLVAAAQRWYEISQKFYPPPRDDRIF